VSNVHHHALAGECAHLDDRLLKAFEDAHDLVDVGSDGKAAAATRAGVGERAGDEEGELLRGGAFADVKVGGGFTYGVRIDRPDGKAFVDGSFGLEWRAIDFGGGTEHHARLRGDGTNGLAEVDGAGSVGEEGAARVGEAGRRVALRA